MKQPNQALAFRLEREKTAGKKILYFYKQKKALIMSASLVENSLIRI